MSPQGERKYKPRLRSPQYDYAINEHAARVKLLGDNRDAKTNVHHSLLPADWRSGLKHFVDEALKNCPHTSRAFIEVENEHGIWGVEICNECAAMVARECPHVESIWNADGTALICTNCGNDGT